MRPSSPPTEAEIARGHMFRESPETRSIYHFSICQVCRCTVEWQHGDPLRYNTRFISPAGVCDNCIGKAPMSPKKGRSMTVEEQLSGAGSTASSIAKTVGMAPVKVHEELLRLKAAGVAEFKGSLWFAKSGGGK